MKNVFVLYELFQKVPDNPWGGGGDFLYYFYVINEYC